MNASKFVADAARSIRRARIGDAGAASSQTATHLKGTGFKHAWSFAGSGSAKEEKGHHKVYTHSDKNEAITIHPSGSWQHIKKPFDRGQSTFRKGPDAASMAAHVATHLKK